MNGSPSLYRSGWSPFMMQPVLTRSTSVQESSAASAFRVRDGMSMASVAASVTASFARGLVASERAAQLRS